MFCTHLLSVSQPEMSCSSHRSRQFPALVSCTIPSDHPCCYQCMKTRINQTASPNLRDRCACTQCAMATQITAIDIRESPIDNPRKRPSQPPFSASIKVLRISFFPANKSCIADPKTAYSTCAAQNRARSNRVLAIKKRGEMHCENKRRSTTSPFPIGLPRYTPVSLLLYVLVPLWFNPIAILKVCATHRSFHTTTLPHNRPTHVFYECAQTSPRAKWPPANALSSFQRLGRL